MPDNRDTCALWLFSITLAVVAFLLNWLWEMVQMPAYAEMAGQTWTDTAYRCAIASIGDVVTTLLICALGSLAAADVRWAKSVQWNVLVSAGLMGTLFAIAFESWALWVQRWSYTDSMPLVPIAKVGLWPLLQLTLLVPLSIAVARRIIGPAAPCSRATLAACD